MDRLPSGNMADTETPILEFRNLSKAFGRQVVLSDVDLAVERGRCTVIIGRSGTGKSVLLKHAVGLLRPDAGQVLYEGRRVDTLREREWSDVRREVSFVFQLNALFDSLTVLENVSFPMREGVGRGASRRDQEKLARRCLEMVGMEGSEEKRPAQLSGGEKKRVALARAIALDPPPRVILYDEPTAGLDPQRADVINKLIKHLQKEVHVTSVVVTHDMTSAREVGDRILMLSGGRFVADVAPDRLDEVEDPVVRRFIRGQAEPAELATMRG